MTPTRLEFAQKLAAEGKSQEEILETLVKTDSFTSSGALFGDELENDHQNPETIPKKWESEGASKRSAGRTSGPPQATRLVELGLDADLFISPDGQTYAEVPIVGHRETWALKSSGFRRWLSRRFYQIEGRVPNAQALQDALGVLQGKAQFEGPVLAVHTRIAMANGSIYLDLANDQWEAVEITSEGWRIVRDPPVKFRRPRGLLSLLTPERGGNVEELRRFVNLPESHENQWRLLVAWLLAAMRPVGPHPILVLHGEQGSAKSTTARLLRALVDPSAAPLRVEPRDARDLMIAANNGWVIALDNVSHLPPALSDSLCRLSTGGGLSTRELYSDEDEVIFEARRPVILNGIEEIATREDLLDRAIVLYLPHIPENKRRSESELWRDFDAAEPRILGALLDAVVAGLKYLAETHLSELPRMADFALWVTATEPALGWAAGTFLRAYTENREAANALALEASPVAPVLLEFVEDKRSWVGSVGELLEALSAKADSATASQRTWPKSARALSGVLRRLGPNLRAVGVQVTFRQRQGRVRPISLEWLGGAASPASLPSPEEVSEPQTPGTGPSACDVGDGSDAASPTDSGGLRARIEELFG